MAEEDEVLDGDDEDAPDTNETDDAGTDDDKVEGAGESDDADADADDGDDSDADEDAGPSEVEKIAADMGWSPQDNWRGDPDAWVDAAAFVRRGPQFLKRSLEKQDTELAELRQTMGRMAKVQENVEKRAYDRAVSDLKDQRRTAIEDGDADAVDEIDGQIDALGDDDTVDKTADTAANGAAKADPEFDAWSAENDWYGPDGDPEKTLYAEQTLAPVLGRKYQGRELYDKIAEAVQMKFADTTTKPQRRGTNRVEGATGGRSRGSNGKGYSNLPADAKAACDRFVADKTLTQKEYVADYFSEDN